ncbi:inorganic polyphosphate/ATP-NAD kinase [Enterococcus diestrammenae]|uniref:NAD kinase n=1 Tax=Enterococcus diestrammenae TaxID=1155073 RepID=A0ABV0EZ83_9ENTE
MELKVAIVANKEELTIQVVYRLRRLLAQAGIPEDPLQPTIVISVGGDGTLLSAFHQYEAQLYQVRFIGVHTGHLGFYTDWRDYELAEMVASLQNEEIKSISYPLLEVKIGYANGKPKRRLLALNESTIKRGNRTMVADVYIKDELFERFRGDGLSISTPTGSTAYNKSVGGAVLHPSINAMQLAEIASLNNRVFRTLGSPIVISDNDWLQIKLQHSSDYQVTVDQLDIPQDQMDTICYRIAQERIRFVSTRHMHFWHRVKDAFIGDSEAHEI